MGRYKGHYDPRLLLLIVWGPDDDDCSVARRLGVNRAQILRWRKGHVRLDTWQADRLAIRAGYHPSLIWGNLWWENAEPKRRDRSKGVK